MSGLINYSAIDPFRELRRHAKSSHPQKAKLNVVLSAITEVIQERNESKTIEDATPTEYFASLMTALEAGDGSHSPEIIILLAMTLPYVPEAVLRSKFSAVANIFGTLMKSNEFETSQIRSLLTCIGLVLMAQEPSATVWNRPGTLKVFHLLMAYIADSRPKIRKSVQQLIVNLLEFHRKSKCDTLMEHVVSLAESVFNSNGKDQGKILHILEFLKSALPQLHCKLVLRLLTLIKKLASSNEKIVSLVSYAALDNYVSSLTTSMTEEVVQDILVHTVDCEAFNNDEQVGKHKIHILHQCLIRLKETSRSSALSLFPRTILKLTTFFEISALAPQVGYSIVQCFQACIDGAMLEEYASSQQQQQTKEQPNQKPKNTKHQYKPYQNKPPSTLQNVSCTLESLLSLRYQAAWKIILPMMSSLFRCFSDEKGFFFLDNLILLIGQMYEALDDLPSTNVQETQKIFSSTLGVAIECFGAESILSLLPWQDQSSKELRISESRAWMIPLFRDHVKKSPARLSFFNSTILGFAKTYEKLSRDPKNTPLQMQHYRTQTMQLWSLFPSFCVNPTDFKESFRGLAKILGNALNDKRYSELPLFVCQGLQSLVFFAKSRREFIPEDSDVEDADEVLILKEYSQRYLPILFTLVEELSVEKESEQLQTLILTCQEFTSITNPQFVCGLFKQLLQKLLQATTKSKGGVTDGENKNNNENAITLAKRQAHSFMSLVLALVPFLEKEQLGLLYRVVKPQIQDDMDTVLQKRSYSVLVAICEHHPAFTLEANHLNDLVELLTDSLLTCSVSSKKMRLRCLFYIILAMRKGALKDTEIIPSLIGEIMLCTKEANGKAREAAFDLLIAMAELMISRDRENGIIEFIQMILGGFAAKTPHMRSAAIVSLARLVFEYGKCKEVVKILPELLRTVIFFLNEKSREVLKSVLGFLKLPLAILPASVLKEFLPDLIKGILDSSRESKNRFRAKIRVLMEKLCRKFDFEEISKLVPDEHLKLIKHIKKSKERLERKKQKEEQSQTGGDADDQKMSFEDFMDEESEEEVDQEDVETKKNDKKRKSSSHQLQDEKKWIRENGEDIVDFLDVHAVKNIVSRNPQDEDESDSDSGLQFSKDGKLVISEDVTDNDDSENEDATIEQDVRNQLKEMGFNNNNKKRKVVDDTIMGREYRAKKAGGDVKKKGKMDPYAYIPLDPKFMAKRNKRGAVGRYGNVGTKSNKKSRK